MTVPTVAATASMAVVPVSVTVIMGAPSSQAPMSSGMSGAVAATDVAVGFCWTQLTDVEQETNGLMTTDRRRKAPVEYIRDAVTQSRLAPGQQITEP